MDDDNPEWTDADFRRGVSFDKAFPEQHRTWKNQREPMGDAKAQITFRLAADLAEAICATGPGYDARVEKVLRTA